MTIWLSFAIFFYFFGQCIAALVLKTYVEPSETFKSASAYDFKILLYGPIVLNLTDDCSLFQAMLIAPDRMACILVRNRMNAMSSILVSTAWAVLHDVLRGCTTQKRRVSASGPEILAERVVGLLQKKTDPRRDDRRRQNLTNLPRARNPKPWPTGSHVQEASWESI